MWFKKRQPHRHSRSHREKTKNFYVYYEFSWQISQALFYRLIHIINMLMEFLKDLWLFMKERKKFWLAPVIVILLLLGLLIVFGGGSAVAPFIYTLF
jgi:hypothetical protein